MKYWMDCLFSDLTNKRYSWFIMFKSNLKSINDFENVNGIQNAIAQ